MKYVFDKAKFSNAVAPYTVKDILYDIRLSPSQMVNFFTTEPTVERLIKLQGMFPNIKFFDLVIPAPQKEVKELFSSGNQWDNQEPEDEHTDTTGGKDEIL